MTAGLPVAFRPRPDPLEPAAAAASGAVARDLAAHLLGWPDDRLRRLAGVAAAGLVIVLGPADLLPWVDGVAYLGADAGAPRLLLPTALRPTVAVDVFQRAIARRVATARGRTGAADADADADPGPWAVLAGAPPRIVSVAGALPVERARLAAWLEETP